MKMGFKVPKRSISNSITGAGFKTTQGRNVCNYMFTVEAIWIRVVRSIVDWSEWTMRLRVWAPSPPTQVACDWSRQWDGGDEDEDGRRWERERVKRKKPSVPPKSHRAGSGSEGRERCRCSRGRASEETGLTRAPPIANVSSLSEGVYSQSSTWILLSLTRSSHFSNRFEIKFKKLGFSGF